MGNLTAAQVRAFKEPGRYSDGEGLVLNVKDGGSKSWFLRIQHEGKRRDFGLGSLKDLSLAEAREKAAAIRKQIRQGIDPLAEKAKRREKAPSFACREGRSANWACTYGCLQQTY